MPIQLAVAVVKKNITEMWRTHFEQLYNSINHNGFKALCYDRLENSTSNYVITVHNVLECACQQAKNWESCWP